MELGLVCKMKKDSLFSLKKKKKKEDTPSVGDRKLKEVISNQQVNFRGNKNHNYYVCIQIINLVFVDH